MSELRVRCQRSYPVGLPPGRPGTVVEALVRVDKPFRLTRLHDRAPVYFGDHGLSLEPIPGAVIHWTGKNTFTPEQWVVMDIWAGRDSIFITPGPIPASVLTDPLMPQLTTPVVSPGMHIIVALKRCEDIVSPQTLYLGGIEI